MRDEQAYREILDDFVRNKVSLFGGVAVTRARSIVGCRVDARGRVLGLDTDPFDVLVRMLAAFESLSGRISTVSARGTIACLRIRERYPGLELPEPLK